MPIAQQLGVTKGSFYWHFRNPDDYQSALLEEWEQGYTDQIISHVENAGGKPYDKLRNLMTVTAGADARLARAIRSWAITNPAVRAAQQRVDSKRLAYVAGLLRALGWPKRDAATLSRWTYCALIGHFNLEGPPISAAQIDLLMATLRPKQAS